MKVGDLVEIRQLDKFNKYISSNYVIKLIKNNEIYISPNNSLNQYSKLMYDESIKKWKIFGTDDDFLINFIPENQQLSKGFTEIPDIDKQILAHLDDSDLSNVCQSSKYLNSLCQSDDFWRVKTLIRFPDTYSYRNPQGDTWKQHYLDFKNIVPTEKQLINSSMNGKVEVVKYLVEHHKIDPAADYDKPIRRAVNYGHLQVIEYLISLTGANGKPLVDPATQQNYLIKEASARGYLNIVKYLVSLPKEYGIDPSANENIPFLWASSNGKIKVTKYLISIIGENNKSIIDPTTINDGLLKSIINGHLNIIKYLINLPQEYRVNPAANNNEAIIWASRVGSLDIVKYLVDLTDNYGNYLVDPSAQNNLAIIRACDFGHVDVVKYLISLVDTNGNYIVDPSAQNNYCVKLAGSNNRIDIVKELIKDPRVVSLLKRLHDDISKYIVRIYKIS